MLAQAKPRGTSHKTKTRSFRVVFRPSGLERLQPTVMTRIESPLVALNADCATVARDIQQWEGFGALLSEGPSPTSNGKGTCSFKVTGGVGIHLDRTSDGSPQKEPFHLGDQGPTP